jgi:hypothetical protein
MLSAIANSSVARNRLSIEYIKGVSFWFYEELSGYFPSPTREEGYITHSNLHRAVILSEARNLISLMNYLIPAEHYVNASAR